MTEALNPEGGHEVTCPHCKRPFAAQPLAGPPGRARGYKCPHCRLFVALDRAAPA